MPPDSCFHFLLDTVSAFHELSLFLDLLKSNVKHRFVIDMAALE